MNVTVESIPADEVRTADMSRWLHTVLTHGVYDQGARFRANHLFRGPSSDQASILLSVVYQGAVLSPDKKLPGGATVAAVIGDDAYKNLRLLERNLSMRKAIRAGERRRAVGEDGADIVETRWIISDRCIIKGEPTAHETYLRRMPTGPTFQEEGVRVMLQSVGDTSNTKGIYAFAHRDGAEEAEDGYMSWSAMFNATGQFFWCRNACRGLSQPDITDDDIVNCTERLLNDMPERDPVGWIFHAKGAIDQELKPYTSKRKETVIAINDLEAAQTRELRSGQYRGYTPEQISSALTWRHSDLRKLDQASDRMQILKNSSTVINAWLQNDTPEHQTSIRELVPFVQTESVASPNQSPRIR